MKKTVSYVAILIEYQDGETEFINVINYAPNNGALEITLLGGGLELRFNVKKVFHKGGNIAEIDGNSVFIKPRPTP